MYKKGSEKFYINGISELVMKNIILENNKSKKPEITSFICKTCKKELAIGTCGDHRIETDHKDFDAIYSENRSLLDDTV